MLINALLVKLNMEYIIGNTYAHMVTIPNYWFSLIMRQSLII